MSQFTVSKGNVLDYLLPFFYHSNSAFGSILFTLLKLMPVTKTTLPNTVRWLQYQLRNMRYAGQTADYFPGNTVILPALASCLMI